MRRVAPLAHRCLLYPIEPMTRTTDDRRVQRPWTVLAGVFTAAHHVFELSTGAGLVLQRELGLVGASALWGTQIPILTLLAARGDRRWDKLIAALSGASLAGAAVHFMLWPSRRNRVGLPILTEAEGMDASKLPTYNALLYAWGTASALAIVRDVHPRERPWALIGLATLPLLQQSAKQQFSWLTEQAATNPAWWNRALQHD
jgi:hypothetical protein